MMNEAKISNKTHNINVDSIVAELLGESSCIQLAFPLDAFPSQFKEVIESYVEVYKFHDGYFASAVLAACASAVGRYYTVSAGGYTGTSNVYIMLIGNPGINKSSCITPAFAPIQKWQMEVYDLYRTLATEWKALPKEEKETTPQPVFVKTLINNLTMEALLRAMADNPKGCVIVADELAGLMKSMNQYRAGGDMEDYLSMWMGGSVLKTRVTSGDIFIKSTLLSIIGTIQPGVLKQVSAGKTDNGFLDRFLLIAPENITKPYPEKAFINPHIERQYDLYIRRLLELRPGDSENDNRLWYPEESWLVVDNWVRANIDAQNDTVDDIERSIRAKMDIYIHRFTLILQMMQYAVTGDNNDLKQIGYAAAEGATKLADYFMEMAFRVRLMEASERLTGQWKEFYDLLPDSFERKDVVSVAEHLEIPPATVDRWLKSESEKKVVIEKIKYGKYAKVS